MWSRILIAGLCFLLAVGCAKKTAKKPSADDAASAKPAPASPPAGDNKNTKGGPKGGKDDPNWLTDPRFEKTNPQNQLPADAPPNGKPSWGFSAPQGGWNPPVTGVQPAPEGQPNAPGGAPPMGPAPGVPNPGGAGVLQPQPNPPQPPTSGGTGTKYSTVTEADMKEVWVFIENASGASGKMPSQLLTYQALVAAESKAAPLVKDGSIYLTGATTRESIWAFETKALTQGGLVCSQNGVETLTAAELKKRLGK